MRPDRLRHLNEPTQRCQTALERAGRKLRFPDDFLKSQTEIHNFRTAFWISVRLSQKLSGISKSQTTFEKALFVLGGAQPLTRPWVLCFYAFMRTTVELPPELMKKAKAQAAARGESLKTLLTRAVASELGRSAQSGR